MAHSLAADHDTGVVHSKERIENSGRGVLAVVAYEHPAFSACRHFYAIWA
jgi:hypothetical protein